MDMRFGTWKVRSLYRIGSLTTVARDLGKYELDSVGVQEVRWEKGGTERAEDYTFSVDRGMGIISYGQVSSYVRELYQRLGEWSLLVIGCHVYNIKRSLVQYYCFECARSM
jgi:hypothetical protein